MSEFSIFSDGAADIQPQVAKTKNILIIPFYVSLNGETYKKELTELSLEEYFKEFSKGNVFPKTSLPSVQDYIDAFTPSLEAGKDILCFNLTLTLSGSHQSALTAKEILEESFPNAKIYVINSWFATGLQQLLVFEAAKMREQGMNIDKVNALCIALRDKGRIMFMVGGLDHLQKGGRIGKVGAAAGNMLKIKPLIELKNGEISLAGVSRSRKGGIKKLIEVTKNYFQSTGENPYDYLFTIGATDTPDEIPLFKSELSLVYPQITFEENYTIGATISAHTGPGTLGLCFLKKFEKM